MPTLKVTLKQHTPLIHFQHAQDDATLRASEVKPKLDKFLLTRLGGDDGYQAGINIAKDKGLLIGKGEHPALDYKMRIEAENPKQIGMNVTEKKAYNKQLYDEIRRPLYTTSNYPDNSNSLIMGNMGGRVKEDILNFVMFDSLIISFTTKNESLLKMVKKHIFDFFSETNFGNRTSKGFGSFLVCNIDGNPCNREPQYDWKIKFSITPKYKEQISNNKAIKDIFAIVNKVWKGLKKYSGAPKNQLNSVFLNRKSDLSNEEDRIPSPVYFKPRIISKSKEEWEVAIMVFLNADVIGAANANTEDFYDLLDQAVVYANENKEEDYQLIYNITKIEIE